MYCAEPFNDNACFYCMNNTYLLKTAESDELGACVDDCGTGMFNMNGDGENICLPCFPTCKKCWAPYN